MTLLRISILLHFPRSWQAILGTKTRELRRKQSSFQVLNKQKSKRLTSVLLLPLGTTQSCCWELGPVQSDASGPHLWGEVLASSIKYRLNCNWVLRASESEPPSVRTCPFPWTSWPKSNKATTSGPNLCIHLFVLQYVLSCLSAFNAQDGLPR